MEEKFPKKRLYKSRKDRIIDGVCGGVAEYFGVDTTLVRVLWALSVFFGGAGVVAYLVAMIIVPTNPEDTADEKPPRTKQDHRMLWGIILIVIGLWFLAQNLHIFPFFIIPWGILWPVAIVIFGIFLILYGVSRRREPVHKDIESGIPRRRFFRSADDRMIFGVCGGLAKTFNVDPTLVRLAWVIGTLVSVGIGVLAYLVMGLVVPVEAERTNHE